MMLLFIPIGIMVDVAEKIDKFKEKEVPLNAIVDYYFDFMWYFGNLLYPIFLFLAIIWFTSKLANNSEIIAVLSSGISFNRYLRPFIVAAACVSIMAFLAGMFIVPKASKGFNEFTYKYISRSKNDRMNSNLYKQINDNEFIYGYKQRGHNLSIPKIRYLKKKEHLMNLNILDFKQDLKKINSSSKKIKKSKYDPLWF